MSSVVVQKKTLQGQGNIKVAVVSIIRFPTSNGARVCCCFLFVFLLRCVDFLISKKIEAPVIWQAFFAKEVGELLSNLIN